MAKVFKHEWFGDERIADMERKASTALTQSAIQGVTLSQSPAPRGWPRDTGFLANTTSFEKARKISSGFQAMFFAQAEYWRYVEPWAHVLQRNGETVAKQIGSRIRSMS